MSEFRFDRLPALPLIVNDPYFSIWLPGDTFTSADSAHWYDKKKPLRGSLIIDGKVFCFLGRSDKTAMTTLSVCVTPTKTESIFEAGGVRLKLSFITPTLPSDFDVLSTPITYTNYEMTSIDGNKHIVSIHLNFSSSLCYDNTIQPPMIFDQYNRDNLDIAWIGQAQQRVLAHSGDNITIDWGYLYLAAPEKEWDFVLSEEAICMSRNFTLTHEGITGYWMQGYDDIASINYFGTVCNAWYKRNGASLPDRMVYFSANYHHLLQECQELDKMLLKEALLIGGADYSLIISAAWRQTFSAHKLIATPSGDIAFLSKENDSNGCIGTVDVSYPSIPLFLRFCPELVNSLCRPILEFASMPVWDYDFAPHDVGRYPYATGQVYGCKIARKNGDVYPPYYTYPKGCGIYNDKYQMPVEECGNMLIMLETAVSFGAHDTLIKKYAPLLEKWVHYLDQYGEDPGEQLCTDDFAGHLSGNVNLSAKSITGIACYSRMMKRLDRNSEAEKWNERAHHLAAKWLQRGQGVSGTYLTFNGNGWSMKYNLIWDRVLNLNLLPDSFYREETNSYLKRMNRYGLPLDNRASYTKSDWLVWSASLSGDHDTFCQLIAPLAKYLRETNSRVPFSDWYDTKTGQYVAFIARSVQGGVFIPMLLFNQNIFSPSQLQ